MKSGHGYVSARDRVILAHHAGSRVAGEPASEERVEGRIAFGRAGKLLSPTSEQRIARRRERGTIEPDASSRLCRRARAARAWRRRTSRRGGAAGRRNRILLVQLPLLLLLASLNLHAAFTGARLGNVLRICLRRGELPECGGYNQRRCQKDR